MTLTSLDGSDVISSTANQSRFFIKDTTVVHPVVSPTSFLTQFSTGSATTCVVLSDGVLKCWGLNTFGQVGDGTTIDKTIPTVIDTGILYSSVGTSGGTTCGITTTNVLK